MAALSLSKVKKRFGDTQTIHGVDLGIQSGEFVVFVGPSGCGKSTLLRMIAGLETVTEGKIHIGERDVTKLPPSERQVAMVFQSYALYPHMTAEQNLSFGMKMRKEPKDKIKQKVANAADMLQLSPYLKRKPGELSGGQCQRVAIGRAIVQDPEVFLFDEPLSNLDAELRVKMRVELSELHHRLGATMIYVTHDQVEAMTLADRIVVLKDGNIEQVGTPMELYTNPVNEFVAGFIGSPKMNIVDVGVGEQHNGHLNVLVEQQAGVQVAIKDGVELPRSVARLGVRPEHILIADDGQLEVRVNVIERLGSTSYLYCQLGKQEICVQSHAVNLPNTGDTVRLKLTESSLYLFDHQGQRLSAEKAEQQLVAEAS
ncbi:Polar-amino-acid-transporting ATPase [Saliniradius amylolyticus]|uniref:Polar-amino-acid-transporting ATPase n=1 Tax=Saliniradius amylolyticus TaxID=2183582 RepID=A0A2S2E416_9ALTE|nr:sn-glycerol-3-phosphate ABC transporter ATP-binding protein UgpC [Saliniradius amylolyticus]AWL11990.1 Polar-amino-acid-transporting ATPase [Saliniradius amylolyticus]